MPDFFTETILPLIVNNDFIIDVQTQYTPDIHLDLNKIIQKIITEPPEQSLKYRIFNRLKPRIAIKSQMYGIDKILKPYGDPIKHYFPLIVVGMVVGIIAVFGLGYFIGKKSK